MTQFLQLVIEVDVKIKEEDDEERRMSGRRRRRTKRDWTQERA